MSEKGYIEQEEIFSQVLRAGRRTYFFDVRETKAGDYYLTITEMMVLFIIKSIKFICIKKTSQSLVPCLIRQRNTF